MKLILSAILALAVSPLRADLDTMFAECQRQMAMGTCAAANDTTVYAISDTVLISGVGRVSRNAYNRVRSGKEDMCVKAKAYCQAAPDSAECKTAQALWGK